MAVAEPRPWALEDALRELADGASIELLAREIATGGGLAELRPGTDVYVPFPPRAAWQETVEACRALLDAGLRPVPHLAARAVPGKADLRAWLGELAALGVDALMLVAGDREHPAGPYRDTLDVLESALPAEHGFRRLGVTAYPEGHPRIGSAQLERALAQKTEYAAAMGAGAGGGMRDGMWIVTQFAFSPAPVLAWLDRLADMPRALPVRIGLAGPAPLRKLLAFAVRCGVGASLRMAGQRPGVARLLGNWSPDGFVRECAAYRLGTPSTPFCGIHLFAFGGGAATTRWLSRLNEPPRPRLLGDHQNAC